MTHVLDVALTTVKSSVEVRLNMMYVFVALLGETENENGKIF